MFIERNVYDVHAKDKCWLYTCSCNARRTALVKSLASHLHLGAPNCFGIYVYCCVCVSLFLRFVMSFLKFCFFKLSDLLVENCTHVKALLILLGELDNVFNIVPDQFSHPSVDDHNYSVSHYSLCL